MDPCVAASICFHQTQLYTVEQGGLKTRLSDTENSTKTLLISCVLGVTRLGGFLRRGTQTHKPTRREMCCVSCTRDDKKIRM